MRSKAPRRNCGHCGRSVAVVAGRFRRHDPYRHPEELKSCKGSYEPAPVLQETDRYGTRSLFELLAEWAEGEADRSGGRRVLQGSLFDAGTRRVA